MISTKLDLIRQQKFSSSKKVKKHAEKKNLPTQKPQ